jgi:hypothetical protein
MTLINIEAFGAPRESYQNMLFQLCSPRRAVSAGGIPAHTIILTYIPHAGLS